MFQVCAFESLTTFSHHFNIWYPYIFSAAMAVVHTGDSRRKLFFLHATTGLPSSTIRLAQLRSPRVAAEGRSEPVNNGKFHRHPPDQTNRHASSLSRRGPEAKLGRPTRNPRTAPSRARPQENEPQRKRRGHPGVDVRPTPAVGRSKYAAFDCPVVDVPNATASGLRIVLRGRCAVVPSPAARSDNPQLSGGASMMNVPGPLDERGGPAQPLLIVENLVKHFPVKTGKFGTNARVLAVDGLDFSLVQGRDARHRRRIRLRQVHRRAAADVG